MGEQYSATRETLWAHSRWGTKAANNCETVPHKEGFSSQNTTSTLLRNIARALFIQDASCLAVQRRRGWLSWACQGALHICTYSIKERKCGRGRDTERKRNEVDIYTGSLPSSHGEAAKLDLMIPRLARRRQRPTHEKRSHERST